jgi:hypothetical protein
MTFDPTEPGQNWPLSFKRALRFLVGGRTYQYRLKIFKKLWSKALREHAAFSLNVGDRSEDTIEQRTVEMIKKFQQDGMDKDWFCRLKRDLKESRQQWATEQRRNAAKSRWAKRKIKKTIDRPKGTEK